MIIVVAVFVRPNASEQVLYAEVVQMVQMKPISIFRWDWERLTEAVIWSLVVIEIVLIFTPVQGIKYVSFWIESVDGSNLEFLPPALIGSIVAYAKWVGQDRAAKLGAFAAVAIAPAVAMEALQIENVYAFLIAIMCIAIAAVVVVRHIRLRSRSDCANILVIMSGICLATALNVPDGIQPHEVQEHISNILLWATGILWLFAIIIYISLHKSYALVYIIWFVVSIALLMIVWLAMYHGGLVESRPNIAKAVIFVTWFTLPFLLIAGLVLRDNLIERMGTSVEQSVS